VPSRFEPGYDLIMVIGPARSGMPLEIGIFGPASDHPAVIPAMWPSAEVPEVPQMRGDHEMHTDEEIEPAATRPFLSSE
jgi:hypothetical protein